MKRRELSAPAKKAVIEDQHTSLYDKYRPRSWSELVGQPGARKILQTHAEARRGRQFLLYGPSGTGKTTAARIMARAVGCAEGAISQVPAAVFSGVENMRQVQQALNYSPMAGAQSRVVIVDECHALSAAAWKSLLQVVEEPAKHVYWIFCTTELNKVPVTIQTRCVKVPFKTVPDDKLRELLCDVCDAERFDTPDGVIDLIIDHAHGSPREALSCLSTVAECETRKEAATLLQKASEDDNVLELCRFLMKPNGSWLKCMQLVKEIAEKEEPEGVRLAIVNYLAVAVMNSKKDDEACRLLRMLDCFSTPYYNAGERFAPLMRSIGQILFAPSD